MRTSSGCLAQVHAVTVRQRIAHDQSVLIDVGIVVVEGHEVLVRQRFVAVVEIQALVGIVFGGRGTSTCSKVQSYKLAFPDVAGEPIFGGVLGADGGGTVGECPFGHAGAGL